MTKPKLTLKQRRFVGAYLICPSEIFSQNFGSVIFGSLVD